MKKSIKVRYILRNATVLTQNARREIIPQGAVVIQEDRLLYVGADDDMALQDFQGETIDCNGGLVLPGLIDGHGHGGHSMTKHIATDSLPFWGRSAKKIYFFYSKPEFWYYDGLLSALERLRFGVTTGMNVIANEPRIDTVEPAENHIRGYQEIGIRGIAAVGPGSNDWPKKLARWEDGEMKQLTASWESYMDNTQRLLQTSHRPQEGLTRVFVTPFTIVPSIPTWGRTIPELATRLTDFDRRQLRAVKALAQQYKTGIHTDAFGNGIEMMAQSEDALLGENVLLQHCYDLNYRELELIAKTKTNIGHSPEQSHHFCPYSELLAMGANAVITSDGNGPRVSFDMFEHMRRCQDLEMLRFGDEHCVDAQTLLDGVTIQAAVAVGAQNEIGSLEVGKQADVLVLDSKRLLPDRSNPLYRCVYEASGGDVRDVFVKGALRLRNRTPVGINEQAILQEADRIAKEAFAAAGVERYIHQQPVFGNPYQTYTGMDIGTL